MGLQRCALVVFYHFIVLLRLPSYNLHHRCASPDECLTDFRQQQSLSLSPQLDSQHPTQFHVDRVKVTEEMFKPPEVLVVGVYYCIVSSAG
eukprot:1853623-Amphidinium_carterae.1